jgi:hypothetical protein
MSPLTAHGTLHGTTIELDAPMPVLEGRRVRLVVEPASESAPAKTAAAEFGCAATLVRVHADFDAPLPDLADYER